MTIKIKIFRFRNMPGKIIRQGINTRAQKKKRKKERKKK
jgi:hypothetical protein